MRVRSMTYSILPKKVVLNNGVRCVLHSAVCCLYYSHCLCWMVTERVQKFLHKKKLKHTRRITADTHTFSHHAIVWMRFVRYIFCCCLFYFSGLYRQQNCAFERGACRMKAHNNTITRNDNKQQTDEQKYLICEPNLTASAMARTSADTRKT